MLAFPPPSSGVHCQLPPSNASPGQSWAGPARDWTLATLGNLHSGRLPLPVAPSGGPIFYYFNVMQSNWIWIIWSNWLSNVCIYNYKACYFIDLFWNTLIWPVSLYRITTNTTLNGLFSCFHYNMLSLMVVNTIITHLSFSRKISHFASKGFAPNCKWIINMIVKQLSVICGLLHKTPIAVTGLHSCA